MTSPLTRRRALRTLFCSSAALSLNLRPTTSNAAPATDALHFLGIGDFGTGSSDQKNVVTAMTAFLKKSSIKIEGMFMIGDNFYGPTHPHPKKDGKRPPGEAAPFTAESKRWQTDIEEMYPSDEFDCPMYAVLGNHDYHDNQGGEKAQLAYAQKKGVRWIMPAKWYRQDFTHAGKPLVTLICLDSNLPDVSGKDKITGKYTRSALTPAEEKAQMQWLRAELTKPRAPFTLVMAHHPLYSNGDHGDTKRLISEWEPLFQEHRVHAYLCGHDHDLQHLEIEDRFTSHILSGGGGARTRKLEMDEKRPMPYGKDVHGFTHISITPEGMTFTHHSVDGTALHRFTKQLDGSIHLI